MEDDVAPVPDQFVRAIGHAKFRVGRLGTQDRPRSYQTPAAETKLAQVSKISGSVRSVSHLIFAKANSLMMGPISGNIRSRAKVLTMPSAMRSMSRLA